MSQFAKRHYESIAAAMQECIRNCNSSEQVAGVWKAANQLTAVFQYDNRLFDRERFLRACEPGANVKSRKAG
jgi:hypothetical protein